MENCTLYSHKLDFDKVVEIVKSKLPKAEIEFDDGGKQKSLVATIKGGFFGKNKTLKINYRERTNPSYKLEEIECGLTQNLAGMTNFVQSLPAQNEEVRGKFMYKLMSANCEMPFMTEPSINNEFESILREILVELDGFAFADSSSFFNKSTSQHFVNKDLDLILDTQGNCEISDLTVSVDAKYHDEPIESFDEEQLARKSSSEAILNEKNIKVNAHLPCVDSSVNVSLRELNEVVERAYALMVIAAKGEGVPQEQLEPQIQEKNINGFTPKELEIIHSSNLSDQERAYATWRYESLYTLLWALNLFPELKYPSEVCDVQEVVATILKPTRSEFEQLCKLRTKKEILDQLDMTYRMNWACVDARIQGQPVGGNLDSSVIYERHYALNWLTKYHKQEWDDVQTST